MSKEFNINTDRDDSTGSEEILKKVDQGSISRMPIKPADKEEQESRQATRKTQGRKGCKAHRITMTFSTGNYKYIKVMSRVIGISMTDLVNNIISIYRCEHPELFEQAKEFVEKLEMDEHERK